MLPIAGGAVLWCCINFSRAAVTSGRWLVVPLAVAAIGRGARKQRLPKRVPGLGRPQRWAEVQVGKRIFRQAHGVAELLNRVLVQARRPNTMTRRINEVGCN